MMNLKLDPESCAWDLLKETSTLNNTSEVYDMAWSISSLTYQLLGDWGLFLFASCPQAASISLPLLLRTLTTKLQSSKN